jgi:uncharacterized protein YodC (DUF2158 family)
MKLKPGMVVLLKSGGPNMTVAAVVDEGGVRCGWFDGKRYVERTFPSAMLEPKRGIRRIERVIVDPTNPPMPPDSLTSN